MGTCSTEFLFFCLFPFSLSPSLLQRKKKKNTYELHVHFENIRAYEKAHIKKDTHTHSLFHMDLHSISHAVTYNNSTGWKLDSSG